ncbi:MAG: WbqC family protein [Nitrospinota bacterium]
MIAAIHQPQFIPWLGYFDKIDQSDIFIFLDNVQYKKNEYQNRNKIKTVNGWQWLTVPVLCRFPQKINEVKINNKIDWKKKHLHALITNYSRAKYFERYFGYFRELYSEEWEYISDINIEVTRRLAEFLGIKRKFLVASELTPPLSSPYLRGGLRRGYLNGETGGFEEEPTERLIRLCKSTGADIYMAGKDGAKYMDMDIFLKSGIRLVFQNFEHPIYNQLFGKFEQNMSAIDLLFNYGEESIRIIRSTRSQVTSTPVYR